MADNKNDQINTEEDISELLKIRRDKLDSLKKEGNDPFEITVSNRDSYAQKVKDNFEKLEGQDVCVSGRIMSWRDMGKASFLDIHDVTGRI